jgi:hypothetical protein
VITWLDESNVAEIKLYRLELKIINEKQKFKYTSYLSDAVGACMDLSAVHGTTELWLTIFMVFNLAAFDSKCTVHCLKCTDSFFMFKK